MQEHQENRAAGILEGGYTQDRNILPGIYMYIDIEQLVYLREDILRIGTFFQVYTYI